MRRRREDALAWAFFSVPGLAAMTVAGAAILVATWPVSVPLIVGAVACDAAGARREMRRRR